MKIPSPPIARSRSAVLPTGALVRSLLILLTSLHGIIAQENPAAAAVVSPLASNQSLTIQRVDGSQIFRINDQRDVVFSGGTIRVLWFEPPAAPLPRGPVTVRLEFPVATHTMTVKDEEGYEEEVEIFVSFPPNPLPIDPEAAPENVDDAVFLSQSCRSKAKASCPASPSGSSGPKTAGSASPSC